MVDLCVTEAHRSAGGDRNVRATLRRRRFFVALRPWGYLRRISSVTVVVRVRVPAVPVIESVKVPVFVVPVVWTLSAGFDGVGVGFREDLIFAGLINKDYPEVVNGPEYNRAKPRSDTLLAFSAWNSFVRNQS